MLPLFASYLQIASYIFVVSFSSVAETGFMLISIEMLIVCNP